MTRMVIATVVVVMALAAGVRAQAGASTSTSTTTGASGAGASGAAPEPFPGSVPGPSEPRVEAQTETETETEAETETETEIETEAEAEAGFGVEALLGLGAGSVAFERAAASGTLQELEEAPFAALDAAIRLRLPDAGRFELESALRYRSSLGLSLRGTPAFALPSEQAARMQRIELSALGFLRLSESDSAPALGAELGVALRTLVPDVSGVVFPKYALAGPLLRLALRLRPLPGLELRASPELFWVALVDGTIRHDGVEAQGLGLGGELTLRAQLLPWLASELSARQAVVRIAHSGDGADFEETERFVTLGLAGEL